MANMVIKYSYKTSCKSAEKVALIDDLITEILIHLPVSSLLRFKSVSKHWLFLISSSHFSRLRILRIPHPLRPSGLFLLNSDEANPQYRYISLNMDGSNEQPPFRTLTFPTTSDYDGIKVLQSCNGLLFCSSSSYYLRKYYVYNPTTRMFTTIPLPPLLTGKIGNMLTYCTVLAFDPSRYPYYKLVSVHCLGVGSSRPDGNDIYQIVVYSSETKLWSVCGEPLMSPYNTNFSNGVYLNGAVHWTSFSNTSIYFKIDEERLETIPMPPIPNNRCFYFGKSGGLLHLITGHDAAVATVFDVYEMEKDCSKWCVRYQVDLREVCLDSLGIEIVGIVRGEREDDSFLLLNIPSDDEFIMFMKYKLADRTLKMLFRIVAPEGARQRIANRRNLYHAKAFEFIQSLSHV